MVRQTLKGRLKRLERARPDQGGRLPEVVTDDTPDEVIERRRAAGAEVYRWSDSRLWDQLV